MDYRYQTMVILKKSKICIFLGSFILNSKLNSHFQIIENELRTNAVT